MPHERIKTKPARYRKDSPDPLTDVIGDLGLIERLIDLRSDLSKQIRGPAMKEDYEDLAEHDLVSITYSPDQRIAYARITEKGQHWIDLYYAAGPHPGYLGTKMPVRGKRGKQPVFKNNPDVAAAKRRAMRG